MEFFQDQRSTDWRSGLRYCLLVRGIEQTVDPCLGPEHRKLMVDGKTNMVRLGFILMFYLKSSDWMNFKDIWLDEKNKTHKVISKQFLSLWNFNYERWWRNHFRNIFNQSEWSSFFKNRSWKCKKANFGIFFKLFIAQEAQNYWRIWFVRFHDQSCSCNKARYHSRFWLALHSGFTYLIRASW